MRTLDIEAGFEVWRDEAADHRKPFLPDTEVSIIALAGIYATLTSDENQKTSFGWRRAIIGSTLTKDSLLQILPKSEQAEFANTDETPIGWLRLSSQDHESSQSRCERAAVLDGLPAMTTSIPANEYFLASRLGHAIHNFAVGLAPLRLFPDVAYSPLEVWFPETLQLIEDGHL